MFSMELTEDLEIAAWTLEELAVEHAPESARLLRASFVLDRLVAEGHIAIEFESAVRLLASFAHGATIHSTTEDQDKMVGLARYIRRFVAMHGSPDNGFGEKPSTKAANPSSR